MKFLIKSTTKNLNRGLYYMHGPPFFTADKKKAGIYTTLPIGLYDKRHAVLVYVWEK